jgi:dihydroflavonol-4-reductase
MEKLCLVTGATGFLGSAVARVLLGHGHRVRVLARPNGDRRNLQGLAVEICEGRLEDRDSLLAATAGCDYLFHVAADYRLWVREKSAMLRANVDGTRSLMQAALSAGVERIVYTSSVAVLGHVAEGVADEETPSDLGDMVGIYKQSKFLAEREVRKMIAEDNLPAVIVNPSTPIGPRDIKPTPTGRIIVEAALGRIPAYLATGLNVVHVDDVAFGHLQALERGIIGERYILGGSNLALVDILRHIATRTGRTRRLIRLPRRPLFPIALIAEGLARFTGKEPMITVDALKMAKWHMWFSSSKAEAALGYRHRPAEQALDDALSWFQAEGYCR